MATNSQIFNAVWPTVAPQWADRVPVESQTNWEQMKVLLSDENYAPLKNQIYDSLVNLIAKTKVWQMSLSNPLAQFKSGTMSYGDTYQEIMSDVIEAQTFKISEDDQFKKWPSTVHAAYHKINREEYYPVTIEETKINRAFRQEGGLQSLVNSIINQMYSSNNMDEFVYTKRLIQEYYNNTEIPIKATQKVEVPAVTDPNSGAEFVIVCKDILSSMRFPNRAYNPLGIMMQTDPRDFVIIMRAALNNRLRVETLTGAFNPEYVDINIPIITVDDFGEIDNLEAIICDRGWLRIFDTLRTLRLAENARALYRTYYYHVHQLYAASPFVNVCFLVDSAPVI